LTSKKGNGLQGCDFKTFPATRVFAIGDVVNSYQVGSSLGEAQAVFLTGMRRQRILLRPPSPSNVVASRLATERAVQDSRLQFIFFVKEISLLHS